MALAENLDLNNRSPADLAPVFQLMPAKAHSFCGANRGSLFLNDVVHLSGLAVHGYSDQGSAGRVVLCSSQDLVWDVVVLQRLTLVGNGGNK